MDADVTITISVKLNGSITEKTVTPVYIPNLKRTIQVDIPNSISKEQILRLKGLGLVSPNGQKGDLFLKFDNIYFENIIDNSSSESDYNTNSIDDIDFINLKETDVSKDNSKRKTVYDGEIHKCPSCGEVLNSFTAACPTCGHEFRGSDATNSVKDFSSQLIQAETRRQKINIIRNYPIPNTKEDILEFMLLALSNIGSCAHNSISDAWIAKFEQAHEKANLLFNNTEEFDQLYVLFLKKEQGAKKRDRKHYRNEFFSKNKDWLIVVFCFLFVGIMVGSVFLSHSINEHKLNKIVSEVEICISEGDYETARIKANQIIDDSDWSDESKEKWDSIRESLLATIDEKEGKIKILKNHDDLINMDYKAVKTQLEEMGFTNIKTIADDDLIIGFISSDGEIKEISINGDQSFTKNSYFFADDEIIITYHTF